MNDTDRPAPARAAARALAAGAAGLAIVEPLGCGGSGGPPPAAPFPARAATVRLVVAEATDRRRLTSHYAALGGRLRRRLRELINGDGVVLAAGRTGSGRYPWRLEAALIGAPAAAAPPPGAPTLSALRPGGSPVNFAPAAAPVPPRDQGTVWVSVVPDGVRRVRWEFACGTPAGGLRCPGAEQVTYTLPVVGNLATAWVRHVGHCPAPGCLRPDAVTWFGAGGVSSGYTASAAAAAPTAPAGVVTPSRRGSAAAAR